MINVMCEECGRNKAIESKEAHNILVGTCLDCYKILLKVRGVDYNVNDTPSVTGKCSLLCVIEDMEDRIIEASERLDC